MNQTIGIIGLGIMGGAIARNLATKGRSVVGFDTNVSRSKELRTKGVEIADSVSAVAQKAEIILTSLPSPDAAHAVVAEIVATQHAVRIVAELSTFAIEDKVSLSSVLSEAGIVTLDCPLSGSGAQAETGDLVVYASGDRVAIEDCLPAFGDFARKTFNLGIFGNGSKMKFVANHLVAIHNVAAAEAMVLGMKAGLDPNQIVELVGAGAGNSRVFELRAPLMAENRYEPPSMSISVWKKDLDIIANFGGDLSVPMPLFGATLALYSAAKSMGRGEQDAAAVCAVLEKMAGIER